MVMPDRIFWTATKSMPQGVGEVNKDVRFEEFRSGIA
jgi:hypothetical protein